MLALVALFILYGSFFPFQPRGAGGDALAHLLSTWRSWDRRGDLVANILFYIPLGLFAARLAPRAGPLLAALAGALLSFAVELGQFHMAGRDSTLGDVYANTIGALAGGLLAMAGAPRLVGPVAPVPALLIAAWLAYRLYPFVPVIDLHKYLAALRGLQRPLVPYDLARYLVDWLAIAWLAGIGSANPRRLLPLAMAAAWGGQVLVVDRILSPADLAGGLIALLVLLARRRGVPTMPLAIATALMVAAARLAPFVPAPAPRAFGWSPFASLILGSPGIAVQAFLEKLFAYGALVLLAARAGAGLLRATLGTAALILALSVLQLWLPNRSGEVTDALMVLIIGVTFHVLEPAALPPSPTPAKRGARKS